MSLNGSQPNFALCLAVSWHGTLYIHFRDLLPPDGSLPRAKFTLCPSMHHRTSFSGYTFATKASIDKGKKNLLSSNTSSTCPYNMLDFGRLVAEILSLVWGTPANFNWFLVLAVLLQRRRSMEVNQTLHDLSSSPGLVHHINIFGGSCLMTEFCQVENSICMQVLCSRILAALLHGTRVVGVSDTLRR